VTRHFVLAAVRVKVRRRVIVREHANDHSIKATDLGRDSETPRYLPSIVALRAFRHLGGDDSVARVFNDRADATTSRVRRAIVGSRSIDALTKQRAG
jgi:hypothetical protein